MKKKKGEPNLEGFESETTDKDKTATKNSNNVKLKLIQISVQSVPKRLPGEGQIRMEASGAKSAPSGGTQRAEAWGTRSTSSMGSCLSLATPTSGSVPPARRAWVTSASGGNRQGRLWLRTVLN